MRSLHALASLKPDEVAGAVANYCTPRTRSKVRTAALTATPPALSGAVFAAGVVWLPWQAGWAIPFAFMLALVAGAVGCASFILLLPFTLAEDDGPPTCPHVAKLVGWHKVLADAETSPYVPSEQYAQVAELYRLAAYTAPLMYRASQEPDAAPVLAATRIWELTSDAVTTLSNQMAAAAADAADTSMLTPGSSAQLRAAEQAAELARHAELTYRNLSR